MSNLVKDKAEVVRAEETSHWKGMEEFNLHCIMWYPRTR